MVTHPIYAEQTVSITELRKNPSQFFKEEPVAVLSNKKTTGYLLSAELYEQMLQLLAGKPIATKAKFQPNRSRLEEIAKNHSAALNRAAKEDLGDFGEL